MAKRVLVGIVVCLGIATAIAWFEGLSLGTETVNQAFQNANLRVSLAKSTLSYLLIPYSLYSGTGALIPLLAWAAGGFVAGLITKSLGKGLLVGFLSVGIAWLLFSYLTGVFADLSFQQAIRALASQARGMEKDLLAASAAAVVPAIIGGAITAEEKVKILPVQREE